MASDLLDVRSRSLEERSTWRVWLFCLALWIGSFAALSAGFELAAVPPALGWALALANAALGVAAVWSYFRLLRRADELERKIQVEALALGFGAGAVAMMADRLAERAGAAPLDVNDALLVMLLAYAVGVVLARRRYA
jgi:hypothetical protein